MAKRKSISSTHVTNQDTKRTLTLALKYLQKGWTQGQLAVDKEGYFVEPQDLSAVRWCAMGAIEKADGKGENRARRLVCEFLPDNFQYLEDFNDYQGTTKGKVLSLFTKALKSLQPLQPKKKGTR